MGVVQGVAEFFTISYSGHLVLIPWIFRFPDPGLGFDIALHAGTLFAILVALKDDWLKIIRGFFDNKPEKKFAFFIIITSIPGAFFGYLLEDKASTVLRNPLLTASVLIVFSGFIFAADHFTKKKEPMDKMNYPKSFLIGVSQAIAIIPGVSRSGATITAGRALGFSREAAARYSFLAAAPIIFGATIFGLRKVPSHELFSLTWIIGFLAAFFASIFAIRFLLNYLKTKNFNIFIYYRLILAGLVIILYLLRL
jgi:undecaprenyl-diphosphatase